MRQPARFLFLINGLTLATIMVSLAISFGIALLIPPPEWPLMSFTQALAALNEPAVAERAGLRRERNCTPPADERGMKKIAQVAASELGVAADRVRVAPIELGPVLMTGRLESQSNLSPGPSATSRFVDFGADSGSNLDDVRNFLTMDPTLPAFQLSLRQADGCWLTVSPSNRAVRDWRLRIFAAFLLSAALLTPLAWWMARRLSEPLKRLAHEATRISLNDRGGSIPLEGAREVRMAAAAINAMQERLHAQADDMIHMLAAVAHDLRTPLTGLRLRAETAPPAARERMVADIQRMNTMISQVLDYVHGRSSPEARTRVDLTALVRSCIAGMQAAGCDVREVTLAPVQAQVEPLVLHRALENLISNAVRYAGSARVSLVTEGSLVVLQVEDDGPGIPDDQLKRVQEPFQRLEVSRNSETGGVGLGLAIARAAAVRNGGCLVLRNRDGGGLCARIELPNIGRSTTEITSA